MMRKCNKIVLTASLLSFIFCAQVFAYDDYQQDLQRQREQQIQQQYIIQQQQYSQEMEQQRLIDQQR
jgi:hypothetical protein